ncbi:hypothetical protein [Spirosoma litoris]
MKKVSICLVLACLWLGASYAQEPLVNRTVTITQVKKGEEPQQVMAALKQDFPSAIMKDIFYLPVILYGQEWAVSEQDETNGDNSEIEYYQVTMTGNGIKYTAVYDKTGKLISYKETINQTRLPGVVISSLERQFPNWRIIGDQERLTFSKKRSIVYRVELANGKKREKVFLDDYGKVLRKAKLLRI